MDLGSRFWSKVDKTGDCWVWLSTKNSQGYGRFSITISKMAPRQKWHSAHRLVWEWFTGEEPGELCVCHHCDNPGCVRPEHLFLGTDLDNARDRDAKGRLPSRKGEANGHASLTAADVVVIRASAHQGLRALAARYGVSRNNISGIINRKYWKHVAG